MAKIQLQRWLQLKTLHLFQQTQEYICQSIQFHPLSIFLLILTLSHTHKPIHLFCCCISTSIVCIFFFASIPITWLRHDTTKIASSELSARKEIAREPISISYNKLAAFDIVFSFHQQLTIAATYLQKLTCNLQSWCGMTGHWPDSAQTWSHLQCATMPTQCQYVISAHGW